GSKSAGKNANTDTSKTSSTTSQKSTRDDQQDAATITYTSDGFNPSSVTVASGSTIKIVNNSNDVIKPSSNPPPTHTDNPELNFSDIEPGQSATKVLTTKGTWGYHNHYQDDQHATIIVQ